MVCWLVMHAGMSFDEAGDCTYPQYRLLVEDANAGS